MLRSIQVVVKSVYMCHTQAFFKKMCRESGVPVLQLLGWIRTRWASMFTFLDRLILLRLDWDQLERIREVLQEPANIQQSFSSSRFPTVWRTLPLLEAMAETWRNMADTERFADMRESILAGLDNLEKWYGKTDDTDVYFICLALDPNTKTAYTQESWDSEAHEEGLAKLESVYDSYYVAPTTENVPEVAQTGFSSTGSTRTRVISGTSPGDRNITGSDVLRTSCARGFWTYFGFADDGSGFPLNDKF
ncbi:hypothetical protein R3P38DRAFT_3522768 [Favolaschia claudopus]|uniref:Uncharacterized protein n=1 Tax=Favolaschia claudopus TaxID=2862362 RepID=A0AAW0E6C4_9AGAR